MRISTGGASAGEPDVAQKQHGDLFLRAAMLSKSNTWLFSRKAAACQVQQK